MMKSQAARPPYALISIPASKSHHHLPAAPSVPYMQWKKKGYYMLWTIAVILFVLWALGLVTAYTASGLIHILLVLAIIVVLIRVIQGRRAI